LNKERIRVKRNTRLATEHTSSIANIAKDKRHRRFQQQLPDCCDWTDWPGVTVEDFAAPEDAVVPILNFKTIYQPPLGGGLTPTCL